MTAIDNSTNTEVLNKGKCLHLYSTAYFTTTLLTKWVLLFEELFPDSSFCILVTDLVLPGWTRRLILKDKKAQQERYACAITA